MSDANNNDGDRRGLERRVLELEREMSKLLTITAVTDAHVTALISTVDSRHKAFERGQETILATLRPVVVLGDLKLVERLEMLEALKDKFAGAVVMMQVLGVTGIIGGIVAIVRLIRG